MRLPCLRFALAFGCAVPGVVFAQSEVPVSPAPVIEWSAERRLRLEDFKGPLPASLRYGSRSWIKIETTWGCARETLMTKSVATFDPNQSWWRGSRWNAWEDVDTRREWLERSRADTENKRNVGYSEADLLRHEQVHFDLATLTADKITKRLHELNAICENADKDAIVTKAVTDLNAEFRKEQARYDEETVHGTVAIRQRQ